jgi:hypothetical protein
VCVCDTFTFKSKKYIHFSDKQLDMNFTDIVFSNITSTKPPSLGIKYDNSFKSMCKLKAYRALLKHDSHMLIKIYKACKYGFDTFVQYYITNPYYRNHVLKCASQYGNVNLVKWAISKDIFYLELREAITLATKNYYREVALVLYPLLKKRHENMSDDTCVLVFDLEALLKTNNNTELAITFMNVTCRLGMPTTNETFQGIVSAWQKIINSSYFARGYQEKFLAMACKCNQLLVIEYFATITGTMPVFFACCKYSNLDIVKHFLPTCEEQVFQGAMSAITNKSVLPFLVSVWYEKNNHNVSVFPTIVSSDDAEQKTQYVITLQDATATTTRPTQDAKQEALNSFYLSLCKRYLCNSSHILNFIQKALEGVFCNPLFNLLDSHAECLLGINGNTLLTAISNGECSTIKCIIDHVQNPTITFSYWQILLDYACTWYDANTIMIIIKYMKKHYITNYFNGFANAIVALMRRLKRMDHVDFVAIANELKPYANRTLSEMLCYCETMNAVKYVTTKGPHLKVSLQHYVQNGNMIYTILCRQMSTSDFEVFLDWISFPTSITSKNEHMVILFLEKYPQYLETVITKLSKHSCYYLKRYLWGVRDKFFGLHSV